MKIKKQTTKLLLLLLCIFTVQFAKAQSSTTGANYISTAVPFLTISPDSRAGAMGDAGVATSPDINSMHWNPAKFAFIENEVGVAVSYTPWLRELVDDMNLAYLTGFLRLDRNQVLATSLRYFTLGEIQFTDAMGTTLSNQKPYELALDVAYSRQLSDYLSGGIAFRYIRSDLTQGQNVAGIATQAGNAFAADVSVYYQKDFRMNRRDMVWSWGINISNIGSKISYTDDDEKEFIPTNLRLGTALKMELDRYNTITFTTDINKLLVPTPQNGSLDEDSNIPVVGGIKSDKSVMSGIFGSFSDAPGGFSEELKELTFSLGTEYWYQEQFAIRAGYFYEHQDKGNRKYFTAGLGVKLNMFAIDFSYLLPTNQNNPLQNTLRFTLSANLDDVIK
ncbi:MAG: type IX secretion system outer membrane channel protein PorV [Marinifilaceae bacterium]